MSRPKELLDGCLEKLTETERAVFESEYRYFCAYSNFYPDPDGLLTALLVDWVRWAYFKGTAGSLPYESREG